MMREAVKFCNARACRARGATGHGLSRAEKVARIHGLQRLRLHRRDGWLRGRSEGEVAAASRRRILQQPLAAVARERPGHAQKRQRDQHEDHGEGDHVALRSLLNGGHGTYHAGEKANSLQ